MESIKLGELLEAVDKKNSSKSDNLLSLRGISTKKDFINTKADMRDVSLETYKAVHPNMFAYVSDTSRRGEKISLALNSSDNDYLVSSISTVFNVKNSKLLTLYLFIYFNRPEFDRYVRFNSWGSARESFSWESMCDIDFKLPSIELQQKVVDVYVSLVENKKVYEKRLEDLKIAYEGYITKIAEEFKSVNISPFIIEKNLRKLNSNINIHGISNDKKFIKAKRDSENLEKYKLVKINEFAFRPVLDQMDSKFTIALNKQEDCAVSPAYTVFGVNEEIILPEYLMIWLSRKEIERWLAFNSWGSARNTIEISTIREINMPIPELAKQSVVVQMFKVYEQRKKIVEELNKKISEICPILIKGSLE